MLPLSMVGCVSLGRAVVEPPVGKQRVSVASDVSHKREDKVMDHNRRSDSDDRHVSPPSGGMRTQPVLTSTELFGANREIIIRHGDQDYRLRRTSTGKLILTK